MVERGIIRKGIGRQTPSSYKFLDPLPQPDPGLKRSPQIRIIVRNSIRSYLFVDAVVCCIEDRKGFSITGFDTVML